MTRLRQLGILLAGLLLAGTMVLLGIWQYQGYVGQGAADDEEAQLAAGRRMYAKLSEHLPPSTAAKLAAELTGAPRKALYGG